MITKEEMRKVKDPIYENKEAHGKCIHQQTFTEDLSFSRHCLEKCKLNNLLKYKSNESNKVISVMLGKKLCTACGIVRKSFWKIICPYRCYRNVSTF